MISCALFCDAVIGNVQEKAMKVHSASNAEIVLYSYSIGIVYIFAYLVVSGDLIPAFYVCLKVILRHIYRMILKMVWCLCLLTVF
jgi:adenosine 3'-phospho 5'-phosphosulfate transporter B3